MQALSCHEDEGGEEEMNWLLVFFTTAYSGTMDHIEFRSQQDCLKARQEILAATGESNNRWATGNLICVKREPLQNIPERM